MNIHDATEQAYKNGYEQGFKDAVKFGVWAQPKIAGVGCLCSECNTTWDADSNYCPHCGAKMAMPEPYNPDIPRDQWEDKAKFE